MERPKSSVFGSGIVMDNDSFEQWIGFEALNVAAGDYLTCTTDQIEILINTDPEPSNRLLCATCEEEYLIE
ncbi:MAG: hypothetical protein MK165_11940 [Pirellulaceae bacterium]|nr:hypothetical protein [Pirellulaceae bacterium]